MPASIQHESGKLFRVRISGVLRQAELKDVQADTKRSDSQRTPPTRSTTIDHDAIFKKARHLSAPFRVTKGEKLRLKGVEPRSTLGVKSEDKPRAKLDVRLPSLMLKGGTSGPAIVPSIKAASRTLRARGPGQSSEEPKAIRPYRETRP